ncbi:hypothetical protein ACWDBD_19465 [Streptomyces sp. NPDC001118]
MTVSRKKRLVPTGECFCGCGAEAEIGRWFVRDHDNTAAAALRAVEGGLSLPQRLVEAGFGPERSVVQEAVERAGWVRCREGCAYAGTPAGLAAHLREGRCTARALEGAAAPGAEAVEESGTVAEAAAGVEPGAGGSGAGRAGSAVAGGRAESGVAAGAVLPGRDDPVWDGMPLVLRRELRQPAHQLVTPLQGPLAKPENRRLLGAVRAVARMRTTGGHWHLLLTARREDFGSPRSERAGVFFAALERVVAEYLAPAAEAEGGGVSAGPGETGAVAAAAPSA